MLQRRSQQSPNVGHHTTQARKHTLDPIKCCAIEPDVLHLARPHSASYRAVRSRHSSLLNFSEMGWEYSLIDKPLYLHHAGKERHPLLAVPRCQPLSSKSVLEISSTIF